MAFDTRTILPGSQNVQRHGLTPGGTVPPDEVVRVSVMLRRKTETIGGIAKEIGNLLHLTHEDLATRHGASESDVALLEQFAHEYGLTVVEASTAKRRVVLSGTAEQMQTAFGASLVCYTQQSSGRTFRGREGTISVPTELKGVVIAVLGLDARPVAKPHFRIAGPADLSRQAAALEDNKKPKQTPPPGSFTPQQVAALYSFPTNVTGSGQTIAIIELGGGYKASDLKTYFTGMGLKVPNVTAIAVDSGKNTPGSDADGEVLLDIEVAGAIANGANIAVYFADNSDKGFVDAITEAVHDAKRKPSVVSISWGGPEDSWSQQARDAMNSALQDAATLGVTVTVASGDNGSTDGVTDGKLHVDFPASSPFALACGGTTLKASGKTISSETVWNETAKKEGATGGGVSNFFPLPSYQSSSGVPQQPETRFVGRGVPDLSGDADPATGYQVLVDGQATVVGGTSAVAPLWAALVALLNQQIGKPVGFINPKLYALKETVFQDITTGDNDDGKLGYYKAQAGWDPCTGLGTPNGAALLKAFSTTTGSQRTPLPGSSPEHTSTARWTPVENPDQHQVAATILLRRSGEDMADQLLAGTAPALPHGEASTAVAASPEAVQQVMAFAKDHGLQVTEANATTRTVKVQGSAQRMEQAFGVKLGLVSDENGSQHLSHREAIAMPTSLSNLITAVLGLDQRPIARHHESPSKTTTD